MPELKSVARTPERSQYTAGHIWLDSKGLEYYSAYVPQRLVLFVNERRMYVERIR